MEKKKIYPVLPVRFFEAKSFFRIPGLGEHLLMKNNNFWLASGDGPYILQTLTNSPLLIIICHKTKAAGGNVSRVRQDVNDTSILWASYK
jgi:hypothetical protein